MTSRRELDRILRELSRRSVIGSVSVATQKLAEEIAREAMADEEFRTSFRALVRKRAREIWDDLVREEQAERKRAKRSGAPRKQPARSARATSRHKTARPKPRPKTRTPAAGAGTARASS